jgi:CubicO group peptidase (beta-lactamase class C family)
VEIGELDPQLQRDLGAAVASAFAEAPVGGAVVGLVSGDHRVWSTAYGFADLEAGRPVDEDTVFRAASITKTFTATAIVQLRDAGALRLDDPLTTHLPEFGAASNPFGPIEDVTLLRLLTHTSGLPVEAPQFDWLDDRYPDTAAIVGALDGLALAVPPDDRIKYSNLGYQLLGEVVSRVAGMPYADAIERRITAPLGMRDTTFDPPVGLRARTATGYDARVFTDDLPLAEERQKGTISDGGLWTTLGDLGRWASFQLEGDDAVLAPASLALMHRPHRVVDPAWLRAVGLGWYLRRTDAGVRVGHSGGTFGFVSRITIDPPERLGVVILANGDAPLVPLGDELLDLAAGDPHLRGSGSGGSPSVDRPLPIPVPSDVRPLLGLYAWEDLSFVVRVEWRDGRIAVGSGEGSSARESATLAATEDPTVFVVESGRSAGERLTFLRGGDGTVDGLTLGGWPLVRLLPARGAKRG